MKMTTELPVKKSANDKYWYVIYTKPRQEYRAASNLQQQGFEVFLPTLKSEKIILGKLRVSEEPLFKRYLFIQFDVEHSPWHRIRSTLGVSSLVRTGTALSRVPEQLIQILKSAEQNTQAMFQAGESLRVTTGPFRNLEVIFEMKDGDSRAIVLLTLLNKIQKITLDMNVLAKK